MGDCFFKLQAKLAIPDFIFTGIFFIENHSQWLEIFSKVIQFQPTRGTFPISNYSKWWLTII